MKMTEKAVESWRLTIETNQAHGMQSPHNLNEQIAIGFLDEIAPDSLDGIMPTEEWYGIIQSFAKIVGHIRGVEEAPVELAEISGKL